MKSFIADKKYLLFPIAMDAPCKTVAIWTKNEKIYEFDVPIGAVSYTHLTLPTT